MEWMMRMNRSVARNAVLSKKAIPYVLLIPATLLIVVFLFYPIGNVFYFSLLKYNSIKLNAPQFIGLDNFVRIFTQDRHFWGTLRLSGLWVAGQVSAQFVYGLAVALLLNRRFYGRGLARALTFLPWSISGVLTSVLWTFIFNQNIGVLNDILIKLGVIDAKIAWTGNANYAFWSTMLADFWRASPFMVITLLAGLQTIPEDIYEACDIDGASKLQAFRYVTLPYLKNVIVLSTLLTCVWEFKNVDLIYNLTSGGPAFKTTTLSMYITSTAISSSEFGYGSALGVIAFVILLIFAAVYLKISRYGDEG